MRLISKEFKVALTVPLGLNFTVAINSYKDGCVEMEILNHKEDTLYELTLKSPTKFTIEKEVYPEIIKYLVIERELELSKNIKKYIKTALYKAFEHAIGLEGNLTTNYHAFNCHSKLLFVEKTGTKNV